MFDGAGRKQTVEMGYRMTMDKMLAIKKLLVENRISLR